jgi:hypothetical protein
LTRSLSRDDEAVTEVIGYVLSFALSAMFLLISLNVFDSARDNTDHVLTGVELKTIADRVAGRIVELGLVSQEFPEARMNITLSIPQSLNGRIYTVTASATQVLAATNDGEVTARATTFKSGVTVPAGIAGVVDSSNERLLVKYSRTDGITISGE